MSQYILAIDLGTTGITVLILAPDGHLRGRGYSEFRQYYPQPGWIEHDGEEIWQTALSVMQQALQQVGCQAGDIACLGITNQRETTLIWDRKSGKPVNKALVWQDRRTASLCQQLKQEGLEPLWHQKTGLRIDPYFSATKIHWILAQQPELRAQAENECLAFGTMDCWLIWKLSGGRCHATDYSNVSRTLLYNIHQLCWDDDILARLAIPAALLPEVKPSSGIMTYTDPACFFGHEIPISGVAGDQHAALFGQTCFQPGQLKNTYGTGSFLLMNTGREAVTSQQGLLTTIAWRIGDEPVEYALEGSVFVTGAAIQWLRDGLGLITSAAETATMAQSLVSNDDVYFVPALTGLGVPYWDPYARGLLIGLTRGTTRNHLVRAALESIAYQTRDVAQLMGRESGIPITTVRADGGAVVNDFLMQFQADLLGATIEIPTLEETTALGAGYLAGLGSGLWKNRDELVDHWQLKKRYHPRMAAEEANRLYARWQRAVELSRNWARPTEPDPA
ncbi:MAG: glycerol kinase GlpK [Desulfuromonadaceae bacterium]|nr:glycerol kinase GlpK [Desulfuromonadaceae bacterium]